jgi:2,4-didehydro-3-deoxy-L-rhamnonate hydrolase
MWLDVNGERMQTGNTRTMIFNCAEILSYLSEVLTLMPGVSSAPAPCPP